MSEINNVIKDSQQVLVMARIAVALERIATAMESTANTKESTRSGKPIAIPEDWLFLANRVIAGEKVTHIAKDIGTTPTSVRMKVLKVFERRNHAKYAELLEKQDYGCRDHPSMRLLVLHCREFGF